MTIHIVQIEKHKFVCGLFWQSLSRPRELEKEARALAKKIDSNLLVIRRDQAMAQAGYAHTKDGARRGYYSLAAVISKTIALEGADYDGRHQPVHNWLGAFKLPDGMWFYCAIRDANFLPNGDFAGTKEQVMDRLLSDYGLGSWNVVIGDAEVEELGFHNFSAKKLEDLIPRNKRGGIRAYRWWSLHATESQISRKKLATGAAIVAAILAGSGAYGHYYQKKKLEEERERAFEEAKKKMMSNAAATQAIVHPWKSKPLPRDLTQACLEKLTIITPGGWRLDEFQCTPTSASYMWSRNGSSINHLLRDAPNAMLDLKGEKATYSIAMNVATGKDEELSNVNTLARPLLSRFQMLDIALAITPLPQIPSGADVPQPNWNTYSITAQLGVLTPAAVAEIFTQPGVRLDKLVYRGEEWSIEGVIYAK